VNQQRKLTHAARGLRRHQNRATDLNTESLRRWLWRMLLLLLLLPVPLHQSRAEHGRAEHGRAASSHTAHSTASPTRIEASRAHVPCPLVLLLIALLPSSSQAPFIFSFSSRDWHPCRAFLELTVRHRECAANSIAFYS
jgi:hypothetical protein